MFERKRQRGRRRLGGAKVPCGRFLRVQTTGIRVLNQCAFVALVLLGCVAVALLAVPEVKKLKHLEREKAYVEQQEVEALERRDQKTREVEAVRNDPEYLEIVARDRLNLHRKGEKVFRINRENEWEE